MRLDKLKSFTLIEVLVVIVIIAILVAILVPVLSRAQQRAKYTRWQAHSSLMRGDEGLLVYYNFQDGAGSTNVSNQSRCIGISNYDPRLGDAGMAYSAGGASKVDVTSGRWPGKGAIRFDARSTLRTLFFYRRNDATMDCTVMYWVYVKTAEVGPYSAFSVGYQNLPNRCQAHCPWSDQSLYWDCGDLATGRISTSFTSYLNKWTHVALVSAGVGGNFKGIYLNGVLVTSATNSDGPHGDLVGLDVGGWNGAYYFAGTIDEFALYNRVLSESEISTHYRSGKP